MAVITRKISLDVNSDPNFGAENLTANNARFEINLEQPISFPSGAFNTTVRVEEATVWNTVNNLSVGLNNNHIFITDLPTGTIDVTIPNGNYSTPSLSAAIDREYVALGGTAGLVSLDEDFATQKVILIIDGTLAGVGGAQVDFTPANTFRDLLGFTAILVPSAAQGGPTIVLFEQLGANQAAFNIIEYFKIHSDIGQGIRSNNAWDQTIARINITSPPGSQVVSEPQNPAVSEANTWVGNPRTHMVFWLTDQANVEVDTGEIWSARVVFEYQQMVFPPETLTIEVPGRRREGDPQRKRRKMNLR